MGLFDKFEDVINTAKAVAEVAKCMVSGASVEDAIIDSLDKEAVHTITDVFYTGDDDKAEASFDVPTRFHEFDSHAEPEMCSMLGYDPERDDETFDTSKPCIMVTPEDFAYIAVESFKETGKVENVEFFEPVNVGNFLFRAKCDYYEKQWAYFYGFERSEGDYMGLTITFKKTLSEKSQATLCAVLDKAAESYKEVKL